MNHSMINAMASMSGLQQKLDVIANNIANLNTAGFKRKEASFQDVLTSVNRQPEAFRQEGRRTPLGFTEGWGAKLSQVQINMSQGSLQETNNPTDVAIEGDAMFEIDLGAQGAAQGGTAAATAWTRSGSFQLAVQPGDEGNAYLSTPQGHLVRGVNNQPIRIPNGSSITIDSFGNVRASNPANANGAPVTVGTIKLVRVARPQMLQSIGDNMYVLSDIANNADGEVLRPLNRAAEADAAIALRQGFLEQSNVVLSDEMTEMMSVQRAYQLTSRALISGDTMMNLANNLRG
jgi:flagellar basal-body rod protein FlgG